MDQTDDFNDASWAYAEQEECHQREQQMLTDDPGYHVFCLNYQESNSVVRAN